VRGATKALSSNTTSAEATDSQGLTAFSSTGYTIGTSTDYNNSGATYVDWQLIAQPKFFDVVTYTGNGTTQNISHSLGSAPGCIIVKNVTSGSANWTVYHQSLGADYQLRLNLTDASNFSAAAVWGNNTTSVTPTSTQFTVGSNFTVNQSGATHVAYLFAHNAGGFGLTGTDNVISCGSYTGNGANSNPIALGYEPQWIIIKNASNPWDWVMFDNMRGVATIQSNGSQQLRPYASSAESTSSRMQFSATGFDPINNQDVQNALGNTYIYIAIRRGPMKVPTTGTSVFAAQATRAASNGTPSQNSFTSNFPVDMMIQGFRDGDGATAAQFTLDRLRGSSPWLATTTNGAENANTTYSFASQTGVYPTTSLGATNICGWMFRRAPGFFDEVCYTGTGAVPNVLTHNLGVVPELIICKRRNNVGDWIVYSSFLGNASALYLHLNLSAQSTATAWNSTTPTSTTFTLGNNSQINSSVGTNVAYLFASAPGVSKVGSYTGTGTTQTINCGFTAGSRFVLIKRTDSTGDWYVWDSARGIVAGNDPYLLLNSTAAEVTNTDYIDTASTGFEISSTAPAAINANGGTFIFLAVA
jgi:hypothetical protein